MIEPVTVIFAFEVRSLIVFNSASEGSSETVNEILSVAAASWFRLSPLSVAAVPEIVATIPPVKPPA